MLTDDEALKKQINFCKLTQQWLRFLLHQLQRESNVASHNVDKSGTFISDNFSLNLIRQFECSQCKYIWTKPYASFPVTLIYPINNHTHNNKTNTTNNEHPGEQDANASKGYVSFIDLLLSSILTEQTIQSHCDQCGKFQNNIVERRRVSNLPNIFAINTALDNETVSAPSCFYFNLKFFFHTEHSFLANSNKSS